MNDATFLLGQPTTYRDTYTPSLLIAIPRAIARKQLGLSAPFPFVGTDLWNCYELTWLNQRGKPIVGTAQLLYSSDSLNLIESKSLKLYLMSFTSERFSSVDLLADRIATDISAKTGTNVECSIILPTDLKQPALSRSHPGSIDSLDVACNEYERNPDLLRVDSGSTTDTLLTSNLLRSLCPVTGQPDYASVAIEYHGSIINTQSLMQYITSLRNHRGFHEECCEMIFKDILETCKPIHLLVACNFTRRGGIDINPMRKSPGCPFDYTFVRTIRQ